MLVRTPSRYSVILEQEHWRYQLPYRFALLQINLNYWDSVIEVPFTTEQNLFYDLFSEPINSNEES